MENKTHRLSDNFLDLDLLDELLSLGLSPADLQKKIDMILQDPKTSIKEGHEDVIFNNEALARVAATFFPAFKLFISLSAFVK